MELIELEEAIIQLTNHMKPQSKTKKVDLLKALNHHLAEDIYSPIAVPSFNRSAMDGYAVKALETYGATEEKPVKLKVQSQLNAGDFNECLFAEKQAIRIMTGAPIPDDFDAVVRQEDTNYGEEEVLIYIEVSPFTNYGKVGEDICKGQLILKKSTYLSSIHIGILASLGIEQVEVLEPLKVGIISSGNELTEIGKPLNSGKIYDSNRYVLASRLQEMNVELIFSHLTGDNIHEVAMLVKNTIDKVDILLTTGGVSVGKKDIMHDVFKELNAKRLFWRIHIRPGTPVLTNIYKDKLVLSLSGNPFAALTTFELIFRPMLSAFTGSATYDYQRTKAVLMNDFPKESKRRRFIRAYYESGQVFLINDKHESSVLSSMVGCNCFIDIKAGSPKLKKNDEVEIVKLCNKYY